MKTKKNESPHEQLKKKVADAKRSGFLPDMVYVWKPPSKKKLAKMAEEAAAKLAEAEKNAEYFCSNHGDLTWGQVDKVVIPRVMENRFMGGDEYRCKQCQCECLHNLSSDLSADRKEEWRDKHLGRRFPDEKVCRSPGCASRRYEAITEVVRPIRYGGQNATRVVGYKCVECGAQIADPEKWAVPPAKK